MTNYSIDEQELHEDNHEIISFGDVPLGSLIKVDNPNYAYGEEWGIKVDQDHFANVNSYRFRKTEPSTQVIWITNATVKIME